MILLLSALVHSLIKHLSSCCASRGPLSPNEIRAGSVVRWPQELLLVCASAAEGVLVV